MTLALSGPLLLAGAGKMGLALARGWVAAGLSPNALILLDPAPAAAALDFAAQTGATLVTATPGQPARVVVLAVKPQVASAVMAELRAAIGADTLVVSIAAGIGIAALREGFGTGRVVRSMPNTPAQIGKGITGAVAAEAVTPGDRALAEALLSAVGDLVWFEDEDALDVVTAVSGSGPAYVFHLVEALSAAARAEGLSDDAATRLARRTVIGAAALLEADPAPAAQLREAVTSPHGTTAAALAILMAEEGGLPALMKRAVHAARLRSEALGGKRPS